MTKSFDSEPVVARWELRSVAMMLIATHGDNAERTAQAHLQEAIAEGHEGNEIVWSGVITQLEQIRAAERQQRP